MERGWERAHPFVELSAGELERRVAAALPGAHVVAAQPLTSGLRNTNYRLDLGGGASAVLRLYVADPGACARETGVLRAVAGRVPAPRVLFADVNATPPFSLLEWLEGEPLDAMLRDADAATSLAIATSCGAGLARIHDITFPAAGFLGPGMRVVAPMPSWSRAVLHELAGTAEERLGPELAATLRAAVSSNADAVERVWSDAVLAHADYKPWNLLMATVDLSADGVNLAGVLDWEFACAGCRLIDFATFLRDEASRPPGFGQAFAAGYRAAGGTLPDDWRRLTLLVDLLNLVQLLSWAGDRAAAELTRLVAETVVSVGEP
jgi:Ser/Thr protein kinase RdoA (MazF antagonist)